MVDKKLVISFAAGFAVAAFYFTGTAGEMYRDLTPTKSADERAKDILWQASGESELWRETKYWLNKLGAGF